MLPGNVARTDSWGMSTRPSAPRGVLLAGVGAFAALASLWLPWYTIKFPESFRDALGGIGSGGAGTGASRVLRRGRCGRAFSGLFKGLAAALPSEITGKGWQVMSGGDVALAVAAGAALLLVVAVAGGASGVRDRARDRRAPDRPRGRGRDRHRARARGQQAGRGAGSFSSIVQVKYGVAVAAAGGLPMIIGGLLTTRPAGRGRRTETPTFEPPQPAVVPDPFAAPAPEHGGAHRVRSVRRAHARPARGRSVRGSAPEPQVVFDP